MIKVTTLTYCYDKQEIREQTRKDRPYLDFVK